MPPSGRNQKSLTQEHRVVECWQQLNSKSVGIWELQTISQMLAEKFPDTVPSPAVIARILADNGVPLRHPEILDFDTAWRQAQLFLPLPNELQTIDDAIAAITNLQKLAKSSFGSNAKRLRAQVMQVRQELESFARSPILGAKQRALAAELIQWLTIWLENPGIFDEWLSIRRQSAEFVDKFA